MALEGKRKADGGAHSFIAYLWLLGNSLSTHALRGGEPFLLRTSNRVTAGWGELHPFLAVSL